MWNKISHITNFEQQNANFSHFDIPLASVVSWCCCVRLLPGIEPMKSLDQHRRILQVLSEVIKFSLGVDVFFVNDRMIALAGTGPYRSNIGTKRPVDSYVDVTIHKGEGQVVTEPRYTRQCYQCEYRRLCPYSMVICIPVVRAGEIKGLMGFLGFSQDQREAIIRRSSLLAELPKKLDYLWQAEELDVDQFLKHPQTRAFIDAVDEGLILTSPEYDVLNIDRSAQLVLGVESLFQRYTEKYTLGDLLEENQKPATSTSRHRHSSRHKLDIGNYPISDGQNVVGRLVIVSGKDKRHRAWKGCPMTASRSTSMVGTSEAMIRLREHISYVAEGDSTVLILGETGVGKEVVAQLIHQASRRCARPFETVNCAAIPDPLFESELFGYAPGAFTGASKKGKPGLFQLANGGTIFLDEIGRLSLDNQAKILRILEGGEIRSLGVDRGERVDVRTLAATNLDLGQAVAENRFLKDLYYRLAVIPLTVPPLRDRLEDIPLLIEHFIGELRFQFRHSDFRGFSPETLDYLMTYSWPGNVRELRNTVEYAMNLVRGRKVAIEDLPPAIRPAASATPSQRRRLPLVAPLAQIEHEQIRLALETFGETTEGKRRAAHFLGISLSTLYRKISQMKEGAEAGRTNCSELAFQDGT